MMDLVVIQERTGYVVYWLSGLPKVALIVVFAFLVFRWFYHVLTRGVIR